MSGVNLRGCLVVAVVLGLATPALGAEPKIPKSVFLESARTAPEGREVEVVVGQAELGSNINPSYAMVAMGGGVLGVLIDAKVGSDRAKRAEVGITPLRKALVDFDADTLAIETTRSAMAAVPWFNGKAPDFARDPTIIAKSARLDASGGQVTFFDYVYDTAPDFASIRVGVRITVANKEPVKGRAAEKRLYDRDLVYIQTLTSAVYLANAGEPADNAGRWAANDGALAKRALSLAFTEVGALIPRALPLSADDIKRMETAEVKSVGAYRGKLQEEGPGGTLLFNGGLVHVQTLPE